MRGMRTSHELYRLLSQYGRVTELELYLSLSAAAVSFIRVQDAQKVCKSVLSCYLKYHMGCAA